MTDQPQVLIIGAGIAGLAAAQRLAAANIDVLVLDKSRGIGGRMATRRVGEATFDHGAQFFSARTPDFQQFVKNATEKGIAQAWRPSLPDSKHSRWMGVAGMNIVPKMLGENLTILKGEKAALIEALDSGWQVTTEDADQYKAAALLIAIPAPQALELLKNSTAFMPTLTTSPLEKIAYHPCLAVLATLEHPTNIPAPGGLQTETGIVRWLADNLQKGISNISSVTIHASPEFSSKHLDGDLQAAGKLMLESVRHYVRPENILDWQVHRWRYSLAYQRHSFPFWDAGTDAPLLFGGDGFGIGNVEGAYLSGVAMAEQLKGILL